MVMLEDGAQLPAKLIVEPELHFEVVVLVQIHRESGRVPGARRRRFEGPEIEELPGERNRGTDLLPNRFYPSTTASVGTRLRPERRPADIAQIGWEPAVRVQHPQARLTAVNGGKRRYPQPRYVPARLQ